MSPKWRRPKCISPKYFRVARRDERIFNKYSRRGGFNIKAFYAVVTGRRAAAMRNDRRAHSCRAPRRSRDNLVALSDCSLTDRRCRSRCHKFARAMHLRVRFVNFAAAPGSPRRVIRRGALRVSAPATLIRPLFIPDVLDDGLPMASRVGRAVE